MYSEFYNPRLVGLYDTLNALGDDSEFFCRIAKELLATSIIDMGCGTGLLTCELAKRGYHVTGIEPSSAMLEVARQKPYSEQVKWIEGSTEKLDGLTADLVLMTSHVAQFFLEDATWQALLKAAHASLAPGGHIVFDSRNPLSKPWEKWTRAMSSKKITTPSGRVEMWYQLTEAKDNRVAYEIHYLFEDSGEELVSENELIYRSHEQIAQLLSHAGFSVQTVYGDWDGSSASPKSPEMIFVGVKS